MSLVVQIAIAVSATFLLLSFIHLAFAGYFRARLVRRAKQFGSKSSPSSVSPKASVLMAVRGCDESLQQNLKAIVNQQYADYEVIVVVDNHQDPAWEIVQRAKREDDPNDRLRFYELNSPSDHCSLKCSALVQATTQLRADCEVIVLIDSDVVPHVSWLQEVVEPLSDPTVGVVTGSQWHSPSDPTAGSLLRSLWNCGAIVASAINANPWAGTCAMRYADVQRSGLIEKWSRSVVDDGPIKSTLAELGLKVHFDPRLIMINRETCSVQGAGQYVTRMLTWSRIFEPTFLGTVVHALAMSGLYLLWFVTMVMCCARFEFGATWMLVGVLILSSFLNLVAFLIARGGVNRIATQRGASLPALDSRTLLNLWWLLPCCQWMHGIWTFKATLARETKWREITYRLQPNQRVQMVSYQPYTEKNAA